MLKKSKKGFTIVELVIVIAVIGILSAILIPTFANLVNNANDAALRSNLDSAYSMYAEEAADSVFDADKSPIKFVGKQDIFLVKKDASDTTKGFYFSAADKGWVISETAFGTAFSGKTQTITVTNTNNETAKADSTFGDYVFYYAA